MMTMKLSLIQFFHFESCVKALFGYALQNIEDADMVGLVIQNENNAENTQKDKPIGFVFGENISYPWRLFGSSLKMCHNPTRNLMHWLL
jgi:hypothetical protein